LGLWGRGTAFADFRDFHRRIDEAGVAAMEMVAMEMKAVRLLHTIASSSPA
jgi:phosphohistidine phosphatase SixA